MNVEKPFFARNELEYLDLKISREGIMPLPDKVEARKNMDVPTTKKQLRSLMRLINYYKYMCKHITGILIPLSNMTCKQAKWNLSKECQKAFDTTKNLVSGETLLSYPNINKPFLIHTDASKLQ